MAHFALLDDNGIVTQVVVVHDDEVPDEGSGVAYLQALYGGGTWKQTSYSGAIRKRYAGVGFFYDAGRDAFIPPRPFASWTLDEETCAWLAPSAMPGDGKHYAWDENGLAWVEMTL